MYLGDPAIGACLAEDRDASRGFRVALDLPGGRPLPDASEASVGSESTIEQVCQIASELFGVDASKVQATTSLADLGADELDFVELVMELEEEFDITIPDEAAEKIQTVGQAADHIEANTKA